MEIEVRKEKEGSNVCILRDKNGEVASFSLEKFFNSIGYDFSDNEFEFFLARLGLRHAIFGIENLEKDSDKEELQGDLFLIQTILDAFSMSVSRAGDYKQMYNIEKKFETELLRANEDKTELAEAFKDARNTCDEQLCKIMHLQNENEELKERVKYLKSKIESQS